MKMNTRTHFRFLIRGSFSASQSITWGLLNICKKQLQNKPKRLHQPSTKKKLQTAGKTVTDFSTWPIIYIQNCLHFITQNSFVI